MMQTVSRTTSSRVRTGSQQQGVSETKVMEGMKHRLAGLRDWIRRLRFFIVAFFAVLLPVHPCSRSLFLLAKGEYVR